MQRSDTTVSTIKTITILGRFRRKWSFFPLYYDYTHGITNIRFCFVLCAHFDITFFQPYKIITDLIVLYLCCFIFYKDSILSFPRRRESIFRRSTRRPAACRRYRILRGGRFSLFVVSGLCTRHRGVCQYAPAMIDSHIPPFIIGSNSQSSPNL